MSEDTGISPHRVDYGKIEKIVSPEPTKKPIYKEGEYPKEHSGDAYDAIKTATQAIALGHNNIAQNILEKVQKVWEKNPNAKYDDPEAFKEILPTLKEAQAQISGKPAAKLVGTIGTKPGE